MCAVGIIHIHTRIRYQRKDDCNQIVGGSNLHTYIKPCKEEVHNKWVSPLIFLLEPSLFDSFLVEHKTYFKSVPLVRVFKPGCQHFKNYNQSF